MAISNGDLFKLVIEYLYPGAGTALNVFYYFYGGDTVDETDISDAFETFVTVDWYDTWFGLAAQTAAIVGHEVQKVSNTGEILEDIDLQVHNLPGNVPSEVMPAAVSAYLGSKTAIPQVRGSKYVPGIAEQTIDDGIFNAGALANMALLLIDYLKDLNVAGGGILRPGTISKREANFLSFTKVGLLNDVPAYQRRRKVGVGI